MMGSNYQLSGDAPELYQRYLVPAVTSKWAADLVARAQPRPGEKVLDLACGTGVVARLAAKRMSQVTGLDLNMGMLRVAQAMPSEGALITWVEGSALDLPFAECSFDLALCQLGLQFFPDQEEALREMFRVLSPTGRVALSVFSPIERTPGAHAFVRALDRVLGPHTSEMKRSEHAFHHPDQLQRLLAKAGFSRIEVQCVVQQISFPSVLDYVRFQLVATPMAVLLGHYAAKGREAVIVQIADETKHFSTAAMLLEGAFSFPQEAYVAIAHKHI
jgi:ubiquinone/menaquinone biosynthesis C-methylase UbiE